MKTQIKNDLILEVIEDAKKKAQKKQLTKISDKKNLSTEDKFKISLCAHFVQYLVENSIRPTKLHNQTGIEKSRLSEILHYKINNFTIDKLLGYLNILAEFSPKIREHLRFLEEAVNLPMSMTAQETKKLTKSLRDTHKTRLVAAYI